MNSHTVSLIGLANELPAEANGWVKLSPYGDFPKTRITRRSDGSLVEEKFLQRIDAQAAAVLERNFNSMWGRVKRFFVGTPVYKHHPDLARHQPGTVTSMTPSDGEPKGLFTGLEARADGLYARLVLLPAGHEAVEREGLKYLSPFWWVETVGTENGVTVVTPTELISAGLTQAPNIRGGEALDNSRGGESAGEEMRHALPLSLAARFETLEIPRRRSKMPELQGLTQRERVCGGLTHFCPPNPELTEV